jgi:CheY-like chemotaxis protein
MSIPYADKASDRKVTAERQIPQPKRAAPAPKPVRGNRILLVEDETLIAMMMRDSLLDLGFSVVGPFDRAAEALASAADDALDATILDINLGGDLIYPVAERLARRDVPFVFVTGYDTENIDPRFASVPVLQKPIEREVLQGLFVSADEETGKPAWHVSVAGRSARAVARPSTN